jgi:hypothetical protein
MAISAVIATQVESDLGYTRWSWVPFLHREILDNSQSIPYADIPTHLLPASEVQVASETATCSIIAPWGGFRDPFTQFLLSGGTSGTLIGALTGLTILDISLQQKTTARYGLGQEYIGPEFGYCVGALYKEKVYTLVEAKNLVNFNNLLNNVNIDNQFGSSKEQLIWRSKFERFYVNHGTISSFSNIKDKTDQYTILIDTKSETSAVDKTSTSDTIRLTRRVNGDSVNFSINEIRGVNGGLEVDIEPIETTKVDFDTNDYFRLSQSWLIQDPYLADGILREISEFSLPSGNQEFFRTDQNTFYSEGSVTGVYIRRRNLAVGDAVVVGSRDAIVTKAYETDSTEEVEPEEPPAEEPPAEEPPAEEPPAETEPNKQRIVKFVNVVYSDETTESNLSVDSVTPSNPIAMPTPNEDIVADFAYYWLFYPIGSGKDESEIYNNNDRYVVTRLTSDKGDTEFNEVLMEVANDDDYTELTDDENISYLRIEISRGGKSTRTNYHDDTLMGGFYLQENKFFEILGQDGGNIVDISFKDITHKIELDPVLKPDYVLPQEFAWKTVEWYMTDEGNVSNLRTRFFDGDITAQDLPNKKITVKVPYENTATLSKQGYYNLGTREGISFYDRFSSTYDHDITSNPRKLYSKYKGWYMYGVGDVFYEIKDITIDSKKVEGEDYEIIVEFTEEPTELKINTKAHALFDKTPIPRSGEFDGLHLVDVSEGVERQGSINTGVDVRICLDGFWLGPKFNVPVPRNTKINLCGGRYWGLGERAPDNNNAVVFMRSPEGVLGLSSCFHKTSNQDFVLFYDHQLKTLSIRRASSEFKEYPYKYEVAIGEPSEISLASVSSSSVTLDSEQDRTKALTLHIANNDDILLFSVKEDKNYYGTTITGTGDMLLNGFKKTDLSQDPANYIYNEEPVSPIYEYQVGKYSTDGVRHIPISVLTSDEKIIISNPKSSTSISRAQVEYINNNQVIDNAQLFDIYEIDDDEMMIFMGRRFNPFTVINKDDPVDKASHSTTEGTRWDDASGIFVIGSKNTGISWGSPISKFRDNDNQYGMLILESVDYCCSIYNPIPEEIVIFYVGRKDGHLYLGVFIVNLHYLPYKVFKCISGDEDDQDFLWRPPALNTSNYEKKVKDNYTYDSKKEDAGDELIIVASENDSINPQILVTGVTDFGAVSTYTLSDGRMVVFYDTSEGVKMIFSKGSGRNWYASSIILARLGKSGIYSGGLLFYITSDGVVSKVIPETLLTSAFEAIEGSTDSFIEVIQNKFDEQIVTILGTGSIPTQKLSVHNDDTGVFHVFYYDEDGRLGSSQGTSFGWETTNNF